MDPKKTDDSIIKKEISKEEANTKVREEDKKPLIKFSVQKSMFNF